MQVILRQSEIEEAIRDQVISQMSVDEGMNFHFDFRASRGADGIQVTVNILPEGETPPQRKTGAAKKASTGSASTSTGAPRKRGRPSRAEIAAREAEAAAAAVGQSDTSPPTSSETTQDTVQAEAAPEVAQAAEQPVAAAETISEEAQEQVQPEATAENTPVAASTAPAPTNRPSLFGGLSKPVNTSADA
jgi:outer membrane translocation and assembly module TamA